MNNIQSNLLYLFSNIEIKSWCIEHDVPYRTIQDIRHGKSTNIKIDTLLKISTAFELTLDELVKSDLSSNK